MGEESARLFHALLQLLTLYLYAGTLFFQLQSKDIDLGRQTEMPRRRISTYVLNIRPASISELGTDSALIL